MQAEYQMGSHLYCVQRKFVQAFVQLQQHSQRRRSICCAQAAQQVDRTLLVQQIVTTLDIKQTEKSSINVLQGTGKVAQEADCLTAV